VNISEVDWRGDSLYSVVVAIDSGLAAVRERLDEDEIDSLDARGLADSLLGLGFVAAQTYALGAWTDLNEVRSSSGKPPIKKHDCYRADLVMPKTNVTRIELINATANYFKHHDEWSSWPASETTEILGRVGITEQSEFPCATITELFCGNGWEFIVVHQIVRDWRKNLFVSFK
jgi:hypothetical protein